MTTQTLNVLLMEDDEDYANLVRCWLSASDPRVRFVLEWVDTLESGKERLAKGRFDVVLLDLGLPDSSGMWTFLGLKDEAAQVPVILLSGTSDEKIALEAIQQGAQDYLIKSSCTADLLKKALWFAHARHRFHTVHPEGEGDGHRRVVVVVGAQGGAGATTVACHLAVELRRQTDQRVLLIDAVMDAGMSAFYLGIEPRHHVVEAMDSIERLDADLLERLTETYEEIQILHSPYLLGDRAISAEILRNLIYLTRLHFDWLVIDLGRMTPLAKAALTHATDVLLITNPTIPGLYEAKRLMQHLTGEEDRLLPGHDVIRRDRVKVVVNQGGQSAALRREEVDQIFGAPIYAKLPNATDEISAGFMARSLPAPTTVIRREIAALANKLAGRDTAESKKLFPRLLSLFGKKDESIVGVEAK